MKLNYINELYHNDEFLHLWIFIKMIKIYHKYKCSSIDESLWPLWIFIVFFIFITIKNNHQLMNFLLQWSIASSRWIFITAINSDEIDESSTQWWILLHQWICIPMMNFHHNYEFSSHWWIFIIVKILSNHHHECYHDA